MRYSYLIQLLASISVLNVVLMSFANYTFRKSVSVVKKELANRISYYSMNLR